MILIHKTSLYQNLLSTLQGELHGPICQKQRVK
jgi:hypothetical protein